MAGFPEAADFCGETDLGAALFWRSVTALENIHVHNTVHMFPCKALDLLRPELAQGFWLMCWCVCGMGEWGETGRMGCKTGLILACTRSALDLPVLDRTHAYMTFAWAGC